MTFNEFFQRTKAIAAGRYFTVTVAASKHATAVEWAAYIDGPSWTSSAHKAFPCNAHDPEDVLRALGLMRSAWVEPPAEPPPHDPAGLEEIGEPATPEPVADIALRDGRVEVKTKEQAAGEGSSF